MFCFVVCWLMSWIAARAHCPTKEIKQIHFQLNLICFLCGLGPPFAKRNQSTSWNQKRKTLIFLLLIEWSVDFVGADRPPQEQQQIQLIKILLILNCWTVLLGPQCAQQIKSKSIFPLGREDWIWFVLLMRGGCPHSLTNKFTNLSYL